MVKAGDKVRYLNSVGGGKVLRVEGNMAIVDDDGFETPVPVRECVVVGQWKEPDAAPAAPAQQPSQPSAQRGGVDPVVTDVEETPEGERINVVLAYEAHDLKHLSQSDYDAYLVNDSNYFLYFAYMTRSEDAGDAGWVTRYCGVVEPNIQVLLQEVHAADLAEMDRVAVQYIAFKQDREFRLKSPGAVEYKLDTTKFFKLHCFRSNVYFDQPVIALDIVTDDVPGGSRSVDARELERQMQRKKEADRRERQRRPVVKRKERREGETIVVDLHIHELLDDTRGFSAADMLNLQVDEFRRVMTANLSRHGQKIVFIHGKGEGVLRQALLKELNHKFKGHDVQDASFREYGFGATQVTIR